MMQNNRAITTESQIAYWNREGTTKTFTHPINSDWLRTHLPPGARILDYGCGYGRITAMLSEQGYEAVGVDAAEMMVEKARSLHQGLSFQHIRPPRVPFPDGFFDAAMLFAVLTCIPADDDQKATIDELRRVIRPGGLLYISDYWLGTDDGSRERYNQGMEKHQTYGVFELSDGVAVRHHSSEWIAELLQRWEAVARTDIEVTTMNGNKRSGFQWLGRRPPL
jgi:SAM-dependent methyltransferase